MFPPLALMTAVQRRRIEKMGRRIVQSSMASHSLLKASAISAGFLGGLGPFLTAVPMIDQMFSIGLRSGDLGGHGVITLMLLACRKAWVVLAVWTVQPSCWNSMLSRLGRLFKRGRRPGVNIWSWYYVALILPWVIIRSLFPLTLMAPQTITDLLSWTVGRHVSANLSPTRR